MQHALQVTDEALTTARRKQLPLDENEIPRGSHAPRHRHIHDRRSRHRLPRHSPLRGPRPLGAALLRSEGAPESWARVAERHTGSGIGTLVPETLLERLICYADKFYSKSGTMLRKSPDSISRSLSRFGPESLARWQSLLHEFE